MKKTLKTIWITALAAVIGFAMLACVTPDDGPSPEPGDDPDITMGGGTLSAGVWSNAYIANSADTVKFNFDVTAGGSYVIWTNDLKSGDGTKTLEASYTLSFENGAGGSSSWGGYLSIISSGRVVVEVKPDALSVYNTGTFAIAYGLSSSQRPAYPAFNPPSSASLAEDIWKDGETVNANDIKWYSFDVASGQTYYVWWNDSYQGNGIKTFDIEASAYYSNGTSVFANADSAWSNPRNFTPTTSGKVYIRIISSSHYLEDTGTFGVVYSTANTRPSTLNVSAAVPLVMDQWTIGAITSSVKEIWYKVDIAVTQSHNFWWDDASQGNDSNSLDIAVTAIRSTEVNIFGNVDSAWSSYSSAYLSAGETIYLRVVAKNAADTGSFGIVYSTSYSRPFLVPDNAVELVDGQWLDGEITAEDSKKIKWYSFDAVNGNEYNVWSNTAANGNGMKDLNVTVNVFYASGAATTITNASNIWASSGYFTSNTNGKVYLRVTPTSSSSSAAGTFGIVYSENSTRPLTGILPENPVQLTLDEWKSGEITSAVSEVWYSFTAATASTHYWWWNDAGQGNGCATLDIQVSMWRDNETFFSNNIDSAWTSSRSASLNPGEKIYIKVTPKTAGDTGSFDVVYSTSNTRPVLLPSNAAELTAGQWADGSILQAGSESWYRLNVSAGQTYCIWWNDSYQGNGTKTVNVRVTAYYSDGTVVTDFNNIDSGWATPKSITPAGNDTIYLKVDSSYSLATGTFGIVYKENDSTRPPAIVFPATPIPLTTAQWTDGVITSADSEIWYSVTVQSSGTRYFWWNDALEGNGDKTLDVVVAAFKNNENAVFVNIDSAWRSGKSGSLSAGETVYIRVTPKTAGETGTFGIAFNTSSTITYPMPSNAPLLAAGQWTDGSILQACSESWYQLNVSAGQTYRIWWNDSHQGNNTKTLDVLVTAYYSNGTIVTNFNNVDSGWNTPQNFTPTENGAVYVRVYPFSSYSSGTFGIVYTGNSPTRPLSFTPINPVTLSVGQWVNGEITGVNNEIWYTFTATNDGSRYIWWNDAGQGSGDKTLDVEVTAWFSDDTTLFANVNSAWNSYQYDYLSTGETVYIRVTPRTAGETGTFGIVFSTSGTKPVYMPANAAALTAGQWEDGNIALAGGVQWFSFTATSATQYVHFTWGTLDDIFVQLYNTSGAVAGSESNLYSNRSISRTVTVGETYYIRVRPYGSGSGTYKIAFNASSTAPAQ